MLLWDPCWNMQRLQAELETRNIKFNTVLNPNPFPRAFAAL